MTAGDYYEQFKKQREEKQKAEEEAEKKKEEEVNKANGKTCLTLCPICVRKCT